jgi:exopolyphosphatase/guanosine-5'-triphosphate,3'-diphosphate pyrophosphatase
MRIRQLMSDLNGSREEVLEAVSDYIADKLSYVVKNLPKIKLDDIILIEESYAVYWSSLLNRSGKAPGKFFQLTHDQSESLIQLWKEGEDESGFLLAELSRDLRELLPACSLIIHQLFPILPKRPISILEISLGEAVLANRLFDFERGKKFDRLHQLTSTARFLCRKYQLDAAHGQHVAEMSALFFETLAPVLGLGSEDLIYLTLAAYLHDIGSFIHNRGYHRHSEYIISSLPFFRLTTEEIKTIAAITRYHRKTGPNKNHPLYHSLPLPYRIKVQKLCAILKMANALDRSHQHKVNHLQVQATPTGDVMVEVSVTENFLLEKNDFLIKKEFYETLTGNSVSLHIKNG